MLLKDLWNSAKASVVDVQIGNLRRKLNPKGIQRFIVNIRAVGFKLECGSLSSPTLASAGPHRGASCSDSRRVLVASTLQALSTVTSTA